MNPNQTRSKLKNIDLSSENQFPLFTHKLVIEKFRGISQLDIDFVHPLTVLTGTNKIGKTSILAVLACSYIEFQMRNMATGNFERCTWSRLIKFTKHDLQAIDWKYKIKFKTGNRIEERSGKRLSATKKWSGVGKKESQIENRKVIYIDVDRITPAHACSNMLYKNTQDAGLVTPVNRRVGEYFEYIFETPFDLAEIGKHQNRTSYKLNNTFSSFNSASGEDVLLSVLLDAVQVEDKSLILIDELELGLHPKIQRRLAEVLMDIALKDQKQFIVTTHSPFLLSVFEQDSRIFIEKKDNGDYRTISKISVNVAFSKMDSEIFPLLNLFCEDKEAVRIINKVLDSLLSKGYKDIRKIINVISSGTASDVKQNYDVFKRTWGFSKINIGYAAVFDGDQRCGFSSLVGADDKITFLFSDEAPEKFLLRHYLKNHPNPTLQYHLDNSQPHIIFSKCLDESIAVSEDDLFNKLYTEILLDAGYQNWLTEFERFLLETCNYFSEKL